MKEIELTTVPSILWIPETTLELDIELKVWEGGEVKALIRHYDIAEVKEMLRDAEENYIDPDALYVLTDEGRAYAEKIIEREGTL